MALIQTSEGKSDQQGIVAIVVTIIFLIVISLTAFGLARLARREQRQSLDNQLSSQALYLAQAGVNDAIKATQPGGAYESADKTACKSDPSADDPQHGFKDTNLDYLSSGNASSSAIRSNLGDFSATGGYSCVLISHTLANLDFTNVGQSKSTISNLKVFDGATPVTDFILTIGWQDFGGSTTFNNSLNPATFRPAGSWGATTGVLRADLTLSNAIDRTNLDRSMTQFLYPVNGSNNGTDIPTFTTDVNHRANITKIDCSTSINVALETNKYCNAKIHVNNGSNSVLLRLKSLYRDTKVTIVAKKTPANGGGTLKIVGAQTLIDVTGKIQDTVKRIQVRTSSTPDAIFPEYAIESVDGICKLIQTEPSNTTYDSSSVPAASSRDKSVCDPSAP